MRGLVMGGQHMLVVAKGAAPFRLPVKIYRIRTDNFSATTSFLCPLTNTDNSQTLLCYLKRQPDKPITDIPTFLRVAMLDEKHPGMSYYPVNYPPLKGTSL